MKSITRVWSVSGHVITFWVISATRCSCYYTQCLGRRSKYLNTQSHSTACVIVGQVIILEFSKQMYPSSNCGRCVVFTGDTVATSNVNKLVQRCKILHFLKGICHGEFARFVGMTQTPQHSSLTSLVSTDNNIWWGRKHYTWSKRRNLMGESIKTWIKSTGSSWHDFTNPVRNVNSKIPPIQI